MAEFPDGFPDGFEEVIRKVGAREQKIHVFRVAKLGELCDDAFISTYEEVKRGIRPPSKRDTGIGYYSTSCDLERGEVEYFLEIIMRHHPKPIIIEGITDGGCGLSQKSSERPEYDDSSTHVDWWVFKNVSPSKYFNIVEKDGESNV